MLNNATKLIYVIILALVCVGLVLLVIGRNNPLEPSKSTPTPDTTSKSTPTPDTTSKSTQITDPSIVQNFKEDVRDRIQQADDKVYDSEMKRAARAAINELNGLFRVVDLEFEDTLNPYNSAHSAQLTAALGQGEVKSILSRARNSNACFVVLGYANGSDSSDDAKILLATSKDSAIKVKDMMINEFDIRTMIYPFGMGSRGTMQLNQRLNRVEVWLAVRAR